MKNIDDLVGPTDDDLTGPIYWSGSQPFETLKEQMELYRAFTKIIEELAEKKKTYDEIINKDTSDDKEVSFKNSLQLYSMAKEQHNHSLIEWLLSNHPDLKKYIQLIDAIQYYKEQRGNIISRINFRNFGNGENFKEICFTNHCLVKIDEELVCMYCGASTKDYSLSKEEFEFLVRCAEIKGILLKEVTKANMDLLKVLIQENNDYRSRRRPLDEIKADWKMDDMDWAEEYYLDDESEISVMRDQIKLAQILDSMKWQDKTVLSEEDAIKSYIQFVQEGTIDDVAVIDPIYLQGEKLAELQAKLTKRISSLEQSDRSDKDMLLEECLVTKYELAILSGMNIPELLANCTSEREKIALTKAYINMSSQDGRIKSGYFASRNEAICYDCITASPEINQRILEMKFKTK